VIDGPSMIYENDHYFLFWSSFNSYNKGKYCVGFATSDNPLGPFIQSKNPIIWEDGGHSTWFLENATQTRKIVYHQPNAGPERAIIKNLNYDIRSSSWAVDPSEKSPIIWKDYPLLLPIIGGLICIPIIVVFWIKRKNMKSKKH